MGWLSRTRQAVPYGVRRIFRRRWHAVQMFMRLSGVHPRTCPICGYHGYFRAWGVPLVLDMMCARCDALDRHRLFALMDQQHDILRGVRSMLHFAPENVLQQQFARRFPDYRGVDRYRADVDFNCDIEDTRLAADSVDAVFASHILEHVDDRNLWPIIEVSRTACNVRAVDQARRSGSMRRAARFQA